MNRARFNNVLRQIDHMGYRPFRPLMEYLNSPYDTTRFKATEYLRSKWFRVAIDLMQSECLELEWLTSCLAVQGYDPDSGQWNDPLVSEKNTQTPWDCAQQFGFYGPVIRAGEWGSNSTSFYHDSLTESVLGWAQHSGGATGFNLVHHFRVNSERFKPKAIPTPDDAIAQRCRGAIASAHAHLDRLNPLPVSHSAVVYMRLHSSIINLLWGCSIRSAKSYLAAHKYRSVQEWWAFASDDCIRSMAIAFEAVPQWIDDLDDIPESVLNYGPITLEQAFPDGVPKLARGDVQVPNYREVAA